ncbi:hypothetical protein ZIOFF_063060 [Zingiber officinale]|uniref:phosphatidate phosphatase n=1 Tax=Zingiber officinale TaxID=94328 RepID=A0A8J5KJU4_ZINOF|nr:hypothetical protein ZIOFF_063060 [Zingiber officinale]
MYAVEKLGSYISRGVYTVSGPFHPFGGAVDIIVVQQQDGSFKSSPWYVRFEKFQGVLKMKEKLVKISVNGVEAGFNMYLDHKGEAFFLRDAEDGEQEFFMSPPTSGDEIEGRMKNDQFEKTQSFYVEGGQKEMVTQVDNENDKLVTMSSKRSTILGFVFRRKTFKEIHGGENMERVSALERAEIAADLLETPSRKDCLHHSENLNSYGEEMDNDPEKPISSRDNLEEARYRIIEEPAEVYSSENGEKSTNVRKNPESVSGSPGYNLQIDNLDRVGISCDSSVSDVDGLSLVMNNMLTGKFSKQMVSHEEVQIETMEITDTGVRNKIVPDLVAVQSEETGVQISGNREVASFSYCQTLESSTDRLNVSDYKTSDNLELVSGGFEHCENGIFCESTNMVLEVSSIAEEGAALSNEHSEYLHYQTLEIARKSGFSGSEKSQYDSPIEEALIGSDSNGFGTISNPMPCSEQISSTFPFSLNKQIPSEIISVDVVAGEFAHAQEIDFQKFDLLGNCYHMEETETAQVASLSASIPSNPLKYDVFMKSDSTPEILNSYKSDNATQNSEGFDIKYNLKRSHSLEDINVAQDLDIISKHKEVAEYSVPCSESSDDVQFPLSDVDNFGAKEIDSELSSNEKVGETEDSQLLNAEIDLEEKYLEIRNNKSSLSNSDVFCSHSSSISISSCKRCSGENDWSSRSLPIVQSDIEDLEGSALHHSLSCSLVEENNMQETVTSDDSEEESRRSFTNVTIGMGKDAACREFDAEKVNLEKFIVLGPSVVNNERLVVRIGDQYFPWSAAAPTVLGIICFGKKVVLEPEGMIHVERAEKTLGTSKSMLIQPRGNWNIWPFVKRSKTLSNPEAITEVSNDMIADPDFKSNGRIAQASDMIKIKNSKSFSTAMLGLQQVDARIYLWKWNTQIVISDVDGTITKSDVLGQFMPLVGIDWSQTGVAHLFSGIKDNGYQLLFLSARAISQAHLTRQFLFNLKQDGKALPDGPVVISPDGFFPSLYREGLQFFSFSPLIVAIKALFPPDSNPFYAGFGNRGTDEISYLKVGIPIGKIFIINPKGQVAVNRRVDTKSYASLHQFVNGIFPPMTSFEQVNY